MALWSVLRIVVPVFFIALLAAFAFHGVYL